MASARIRDVDHKLLQELSKKTGLQYQEIVHEALDMYRRDRLLDEINIAFGKLRADPQAWADETSERGAWDDAVGDGLTHD